MNNDIVAWGDLFKVIGFLLAFGATMAATSALAHVWTTAWVIGFYVAGGLVLVGSVVYFWVMARRAISNARPY